MKLKKVLKPRKITALDAAQLEVKRMEEKFITAGQEAAKQKGINRALTAALKEANRKLAGARDSIINLLGPVSPQWVREDYERHQGVMSMRDEADRP